MDHNGVSAMLRRLVVLSLLVVCGCESGALDSLFSGATEGGDLSGRADATSTPADEDVSTATAGAYTVVYDDDGGGAVCDDATATAYWYRPTLYPDEVRCMAWLEGGESACWAISPEREYACLTIWDPARSELTTITVQGDEWDYAVCPVDGDLDESTLADCTPIFQADSSEVDPSFANPFSKDFSGWYRAIDAWPGDDGTARSGAKLAFLAEGQEGEDDDSSNYLDHIKRQFDKNIGGLVKEYLGTVIEAIRGIPKKLKHAFPGREDEMDARDRCTDWAADYAEDTVDRVMGNGSRETDGGRVELPGRPGTALEDIRNQDRPSPTRLGPSASGSYELLDPATGEPAGSGQASDSGSASGQPSLRVVITPASQELSFQRNDTAPEPQATLSFTIEPQSVVNENLARQVEWAWSSSPALDPSRFSRASGDQQLTLLKPSVSGSVTISFPKKDAQYKLWLKITVMYEDTTRSASSQPVEVAVRATDAASCEDFGREWMEIDGNCAVDDDCCYAREVRDSDELLLRAAQADCWFVSQGGPETLPQAQYQLCLSECWLTYCGHTGDLYGACWQECTEQYDGD